MRGLDLHSLPEHHRCWNRISPVAAGTTEVEPTWIVRLAVPECLAPLLLRIDASQTHRRDLVVVAVENDQFFPRGPPCP
jgi:hypothetical protein